MNKVLKYSTGPITVMPSTKQNATALASAMPLHSYSLELYNQWSRDCEYHTFVNPEQQRKKQVSCRRLSHES